MAESTQYMSDTESVVVYELIWAGFEGVNVEYVKAIRYGKVPAGNLSRNWATREWEKGVSCVKIIRNPEDINYQSVYDVTLGWQGFDKYIVEGWYIHTCGSDGEPLLLDPVEIEKIA